MQVKNLSLRCHGRQIMHWAADGSLKDTICKAAACACNTAETACSSVLMQARFLPKPAALPAVSACYYTLLP